MLAHLYFAPLDQESAGLARIGFWARLLLILLRILQGFSAGGEWGGAALMAVEHAPISRRGFFGAYPQIGVPVGMILASGVMFVLTSIMSAEDFLSWGWRIPFLLSVVLIVVGYMIRRRVDESPPCRTGSAGRAPSRSGTCCSSPG